MTRALLPLLLMVVAMLVAGASADDEAAGPRQPSAQNGSAPAEPQVLVSRETRARFYIQAHRPEVAELRADGKFAAALELAELLAGLAEHELGPDDPVTLSTSNDLAVMYLETGRYDEAEPLLLHVVAAQQAMYGESHPESMTAVGNLASTYMFQGRHSMAEPLYLEVLRSREEHAGEGDPGTITALNNLASLYREQLRFHDAETLFVRALRASRAALGDLHNSTLIATNNLAGLYQDMQRHDDAESLFREALRRSREGRGEDHIHTLGLRNNLANFYTDQGRFDEAEPMLDRVLREATAHLGEDHPDVLRTTNILAIVYRQTGRAGDAERLFLRALERSETVLGNAHPLSMTLMKNLMVLYFATGDAAKIPPMLERLEGAAFAYTDAELPNTLGEAQKRRFLAQQAVLEDLALNLAIRYPTEPHRRLAATLVLRWSQVQGEELAFLQGLSRRSDDPGVRALAAEIRTARAYLSRLANQASPNPGRLQAALDELADLEIRLSQRSRVYRRHLAIRDLDSDDVRAALPDNSAVVVLTAYQPIDDGQQEDPPPLRYAAMLLSADGADDLYLHDAGAAEEFRTAGLALKAGREAAASRMYDRLFGQWDGRLRGLDSIYVVPDGWLHLINPERLILPDGRYWVERQPVHRLQTARDLVRDFPTPARTGGLVALGGIDYGPGRASMPMQPRQQ